MKLRYALISAMLIGLLTACGGGGSSGGGYTPPSSGGGGGGGTTPSALLKAGFGANVVTGAIKADVRRFSAGTQSLLPLDAVLGGAIVPIADFQVNDPYITTALGFETGVQAVAYLDTSNGSALPSPLPSAGWAITGNTIPNTTLNITPTPAPTGAPLTVIGVRNVSNPTTIGISTFTASALGQNAVFNAYAYRGLGISQSGDQYGPQYLSFDGSGAAQSTDSAHAEFTVSVSGTTTTLNAPHGILSVAKWIDAVTAADYDPSKASTSMTANSVQTCGGAPTTFIIKLADARLVKWDALEIRASSNTLAATCTWIEAQGPYAVTSGGAFAY